jgi:hypothetical protein
MSKHRYPEPLERRRPHAREHYRVLQLDINGVPQAWISQEEAAGHMATDSVAWFDGAEPLAVMRGGFNARTGRQSTLEIYPIVALRGAASVNLFEVPPVFSSAKCFARDLHRCAYCNQVFPVSELTIDHILPASRGGKLSFMNAVTADRFCNGRKANRTPEEAGMPLVYLPYVPSRFEDFLLAGRNIRADVHEWLASRLPKGSRLS